MAQKVSLTELRNMQMPDLTKETAGQRALVAKLGHDVKMLKDKNSAKYKAEKKHLARMETILSEKKMNTPKKSSPTAK